MEIGFPLKESSILLKHASARGAEPVAQQRPRITDMGRLRAEGAWNRWFHQRPRSNDQGAASNCEICTEASGTEQFLQAGVYFFFNYGIAICADSRLSGFAKNINVEKHQRLKHS